jgi:hypothetical protein
LKLVRETRAKPVINRVRRQIEVGGFKRDRDSPRFLQRRVRVGVVLVQALGGGVDQLSRFEVERRDVNLEIEMRTDHLESDAGDYVAVVGDQVVQVHGALLPRERVVVLSVDRVLVGDLVVFDWDPVDGGQVDVTAWQKFALLDLQVDDAIVLDETQSCDDSEM